MTTPIDDIAARVRKRFERAGRIKSFAEHLEDVGREPRRYTRSSTQYVLDMIEHFGAEEVTGIGGTAQRYRVFDVAFDGGRNRVWGQEEVQEDIVEALRSFVLTGRSDRLVLMHGPNGSAKSSIVDALFRGLEHYSHLDEGALFCFQWVFPKMRGLGRQVGFDATEQHVRGDSYAFLELGEIAARVPCELRDHPLWMLPRDERERILVEAHGRVGDASPPSSYVLEGELCPKCRAIHEALLASYGGDLARLLAHVQVERYFVSRRYRVGAVTIDPQVTTDAGARQITMDRSLADLPPSLQNVNLFQMQGDLVDGSGGIVEYSDLLKRSTEANKYLLTACETGFVALGSVAAQLNVVMLGSSNERHLDLFKKSPDFTSFKGRFRLVPTPYLLQYAKEARIYEDQVEPLRVLKHLAPHTTRLAAMWAVLTRLRRPDPATFATEARELVRKLSPLEKAKLYDHEETPSHLDAREKNALRHAIRMMRDEFREDPRYEGRYGASPREMRDVLTECFYDRRYACVTPLALFAALARLVQERTLYEFLSLEPDNQYHDPAAFIEDVREEYLDRVNEEVRDSLDLVSGAEYTRIFERYVMNVKAYVKRERIYADTTQTYVPADERFMAEVERVLGVGELPSGFRDSLIGRIGAFSVDHPGQEIDYVEVFPELVSRLENDYYRNRKKAIEQISRHLLTAGTDEFEHLDAEVKAAVSTALERMRTRHGYCERCAKEAIVHLIKRRYS